MKTIIAKSATLQNLMGCQNLIINFNKDVTNIFGQNGSGKSRVVDTFNWVLFGKNAAGKSDHGIKNTKDTSFNQQEHIGIIVLDVDGQEITLKRIYKEKWVKPTGAEVAELKGHETKFEFNHVPMNAGDYAKKVESILNDSVFKMITNPLYFTSLDWKKQRDVLTEICPAPSNEELAGTSPEYLELISHLVQGKELEDYRKQVANTIVESKANLKAIPTRIDEALKSKVEIFAWDELEKEKVNSETSLATIEKTLTDKASAFDDLLKEENAKKLAANGVKNQIDTLKQNLINSSQNASKQDDSKLKLAQSQLSSKEAELLTAENGLKTLETKKLNLESDIKSLDEKLVAKRSELKTVSDKEFVFDETQCVCPTCKREFESGDVEAKKAELKQNFNLAQSKEIGEIQQSGIRLKNEKESAEAELKGIVERIANGTKIVFDTKTEIELLKGNVENEKSALQPIEETVFDLEKALSESKEYQTLLAEFDKINATIKENPEIDNTELNNQKAELTKLIDEIKTKLRNKDQNAAVDKRIEDLKIEQKNLASEIANVEKNLFVIDKFNKLKVESIEDQVNNRFKYVKFRLFKDLINGGTEEVCEALVDNVPYSFANTAGRLNAGLDIINLLSEHFQARACIFLDNRESTSHIIDTESQIINLIVSDSDEVLRVG